MNLGVSSNDWIQLASFSFLRELNTILFECWFLVLSTHIHAVGATWGVWTAPIGIVADIYWVMVDGW